MLLVYVHYKYIYTHSAGIDLKTLDFTSLNKGPLWVFFGVNDNLSLGHVSLLVITIYL